MGSESRGEGLGLGFRDEGLGFRDVGLRSSGFGFRD